MRGIHTRKLAASVVALVLGASTLLWSVPARSDTGSLSARPNFAKFVVIGDSLLAGFRDGSLYESAQATSMAKMVATQGGATLIQPTIGEPGIPNRLTLVPPSPFPVPVPGTSPGRTNIFVQNFNLAVPGQKVLDGLQTRPRIPPGAGGLADLVLGFPSVYVLNQTPKSQIELAEQIRPTFILLWLGANDVLGAALSGDATLVTDVAQFTTDYITLIGRARATGAEVVVANVPDVTSIPSLFGWREIQQVTNAPFDVTSGLLGLRKGDLVPLSQFALIQAILTGQRLGPLPAGAILTIEEQKIIRLAVKAMNKAIARNAAGLGIKVADANALLAGLKKNGFTLPNGTHLTAAFLGGLFSLDGVHPTAIGNAIAANAFIDAINSGRAAADQLSHVNLASVAAVDPFVEYVERGFSKDIGHAVQSLDFEALQRSYDVIIGKDR